MTKSPNLGAMNVRNAGVKFLPADDVGLLDLEAVVADAAKAVVKCLDLHPALVSRPSAAQAEPDIGSLVKGAGSLIKAEIVHKC